MCNIKCRLYYRYSPQNIFNAKNFNPHKKPISLLNVPSVCSEPGGQKPVLSLSQDLILLYHMYHKCTILVSLFACGWSWVVKLPQSKVIKTHVIVPSRTNNWVTSYISCLWFALLRSEPKVLDSSIRWVGFFYQPMRPRQHGRHLQTTCSNQFSWFKTMNSSNILLKFVLIRVSKKRAQDICVYKSLDYAPKC